MATRIPKYMYINTLNGIREGKIYQMKEYAVAQAKYLRKYRKGEVKTMQYELVVVGEVEDEAFN